MHEMASSFSTPSLNGMKVSSSPQTAFSQATLILNSLTPIYTPAWVGRGTVRVTRLAQEQKCTMTPSPALEPSGQPTLQMSRTWDRNQSIPGFRDSSFLIDHI